MAQSRLSLSRYENQAIKYYVRPDDLFANKNDIFEAESSVPSLLADFKKLFKLTQIPENGLHDVIIEFDEDQHQTRILAQRQLLMARSNYFDQMFKEYNGRPDFVYLDDQCTINDVNKDGILELKFSREFCPDSRLFKEIVLYMYWAYIELDTKETKTKFEVFKLAARLELKDLRNVVGKALAEELTKENIAEVLLFGQEYDAKQLKKQCIEYIIRNRDDPSKLDQYALKERIFRMNDEDKSRSLLREMYENKVQQK